MWEKRGDEEVDADSEDNISEKFCWEREWRSQVLIGKGHRVKYELQVWDEKKSEIEHSKWKLTTWVLC